MAQTGISANRLELLQIADAVAREKSIDRTLVLSAMEDAIQKAAKSRYGSENEIRAEIDPRTGEIKLSRLLEVVEKVTLDATEISLKDAKKRNPEAEVGDFIAEPLPPLDFGRVAAQNAKQVIVQKVREAERERQFEEYKDRVGEIVSGIVKRAEYGNVMIDLGRAEAIIRRDETLPRENHTCLALPTTSCIGTVPNPRESVLAARLSPSTNTWPGGTVRSKLASCSLLAPCRTRHWWPSSASIRSFGVAPSCDRLVPLTRTSTPLSCTWSPGRAMMRLMYLRVRSLG